MIHLCQSGNFVSGDSVQRPSNGRKTGMKGCNACVHSPRYDLKGLRQRKFGDSISIYPRGRCSDARTREIRAEGWAASKQRTRISTWTLPIPGTFAEIILVDDIRSAGGRRRRRRGCACAAGRRVKLTYDKFNALLPVLSSFLPALTPMALGHSSAIIIFIPSRMSVCLSPLSDCLALHLAHATPGGGPRNSFSDVFNHLLAEPLSHVRALLVFCAGDT